MTDDEIRANLLVLSHKEAHDAEHNLDDTLWIALTRRECWHILYGMLCSTTLCPELGANSAEFLDKMADVMVVQKDNWVNGKETP